MNNHIGLEEIRDALANQNHPWQAGMTSMSSLPPDEQQQRLGVKPPPGDPTVDEVAQRAEQLRGQIQALALERNARVTLPGAFDMRNLDGGNYITDIRDQGSCGSCVAFGCVATAEGRLRRQTGNPNLPIDLSEAYLFFVHGRARGRNCDNGWWPAEALQDFQNKGVVDEECDPYDLRKTDGSGVCADAAGRLSTITGSTELTKDPAKIKDWLVNQGPVCACFVVYNDFFSYSSGVYKHVAGDQAGGHCVSIIGYNDNPGYWICKNSWGKGWGEQGFFNIAYGECGIDSWSNFGVNAVLYSGWRNNTQVQGLWAIDQQRNAWAYFASLGWKKISNETDAIFYTMLSDLIAAKAAGRPVNFFEQNNTIKQLYVF